MRGCIVRGTKASAPHAIGSDTCEVTGPLFSTEGLLIAQPVLSVVFFRHLMIHTFVK